MPEPLIRPTDHELDALADLLNRHEKITILGGRGCAHAHDELVDVARALQAQVVHALGGKEYIEYDNPHDVGMTGLIGFASGYHAMQGCEVLLMLGTDFPYRQFYPSHAKIVQIDLRAEQLGRRAPLAMGLIGDCKATLAALLPKLKAKSTNQFLVAAKKNYQEARKSLDDLAVATPSQPIHPQYLTRCIDAMARQDAIFTCDVGTPTVWAARYLSMNGKRRLVGSFVHGSMANALPQAMGAQLSCPGRQVIALCGDGGFAMLMGEILTVCQLALPIKIVVYNNQSLGFVALEQKAAGYLDAGVELQNPNFAEMARAVGIEGFRIDQAESMPAILEEALSSPHAALIDVAVNPQELVLPPKINLAAAKGFGLFMLKAVLNGRGDEVMEILQSNWLR
jgi:pyruvate dehydrogenase (quinone)